LRILTEQLVANDTISAGIITRPQAGIADFYREMGDLFDVDLRPHNRWGGAKVLRQRWQHHIDRTFIRPVLIIDEAQETQPAVLSELRMLVSAQLDKHTLLTTVLAGDGRLVERLRSEEFLPLESRIRTRLLLERASPENLKQCLHHAIRQAGAPNLMTQEVISALADHAQGNLRTLMIIADELLAAAAEREARQIDDTLFFDVFSAVTNPKRTQKKNR